MNSSVTFGMVEGPLLILPLLSVLVSAGVMILVAVAAWRIMKAQEASSRALQQMADALGRRAD